MQSQEEIDKRKEEQAKKRAEIEAKKEAKRLAMQGKGKKEKAPKEEKKSTYVADTTPVGEKKDMTTAINAEYHPKAVEAAWMAWWEKKKFFHPDVEKIKADPEAKVFTMVIPPPNVTGALHLGHALMLAIEDAVIRWRRMQGYHTLWLPGVDHAGIATQNVVENKLWKDQKITRHDLGREEFVKKVWEWKDEYGGKINNQFRRVGISVDWERFVFTLDPTRSAAVKEAFVRFHEQGLIYRSNRLVNWCCALNTTLSDLEVDPIDLTDGPQDLHVPGHDKDKKYPFGWITDFAYKLKDSDEEIIVATTRLETMLGDVAVAVHPDDPRYQHLIGKELVHPFIPERRIVIVADPVLVDMNFGTGAVKITPAHDHNDYACGQRHNLPQITILNEDGTINEHGGAYAGMKRFDARLKMEEDMKALGIYKGKRKNPMKIGRCSKTGDIIEPLLKPQWYVSCKEMADKSVAAVKNGDLKIIPEDFNRTWFQWLENIQDWCVSRQLWWGHRIPAYLAKVDGVIDEPDDKNNDHYIVARSEEEAVQKACEKWGVTADKVHLTQDEDVLDTWFSSGLFPFSSFGWPNEEGNDELKSFFPGDLLETGHDIIFFWVARMVMMSLQLTGKLPFHTVFLHPMVRDADGQKMSKSKGNVVDPLEVIDGCPLQTLVDKLTNSNLPEKEVKRATELKRAEFPDGITECGTDALRFGLLSYMVQSSINLDIKRVIFYRQFCNKLWNIIKFALSNFPADFTPEESLEGLKLSLVDQWMLTKLNGLIQQVNKNMEEYKFGESVLSLQEFWLKELSDIYIESIKPYVKGEDQEARKAALNTLFVVLDSGMRILHPFMPYVTEELFQRLPKTEKTPESITIAEYPKGCVSFPETEAKISLLNQIVTAVRSQLSQLNVPKNAKPHLVIRAKTVEDLELVSTETLYIATLVRAGQVEAVPGETEDPKGCVKTHLTESIQIFVHLIGLIDLNLEIERLGKRQEKLDKLIEGQQKKMSIKDYETKVKEAIRKENAEKLQAYEREKEENDKSILSFKALLEA